MIELNAMYEMSEMLEDTMNTLLDLPRHLPRRGELGPILLHEMLGSNGKEDECRLSRNVYTQTICYKLNRFDPPYT